MDECCVKCGRVIISGEDYYLEHHEPVCSECHKPDCYCTSCRIICEVPTIYMDKLYHKWCLEDLKEKENQLLEGKQLALFSEDEISLSLNFEEV